jgi:hypothetical protein
MTRAGHILTAIDDLVASFIYYDRKEDEDLPRGDIEAAVEAGEITQEQMVQAFSAALREALE